MRFKREGKHVYPWLIRVAVRQKLLIAQYCKAIILQLKINFKKRGVKEAQVSWLGQGMSQEVNCQMAARFVTAVLTFSLNVSSITWRSR